MAALYKLVNPRMLQWTTTPLQKKINQQLVGNSNNSSSQYLSMVIVL